MTSHSDYAKTRQPKPMQVWEHSYPNALCTTDVALVLGIYPEEEHNQIHYRKLQGGRTGTVFVATLHDFTKMYHFSH